MKYFSGFIFLLVIMISIVSCEKPFDDPTPPYIPGNLMRNWQIELDNGHKAVLEIHDYMPLSFLSPPPGNGQLLGQLIGTFRYDSLEVNGGGPFYSTTNWRITGTFGDLDSAYWFKGNHLFRFTCRTVCVSNTICGTFSFFDSVTGDYTTTGFTGTL